MDIATLTTLITACGGVLAAMWAMFKSLQTNFLKHIETSDKRMVELVTSKNGHMERISTEFNKTVREFQGTVSKMSEQLDNIDSRV